MNAQWQDFTDNLVAGLRRVSERVCLVISTGDVERGYVQFIGRGDAMTVEAAAAYFISDTDESVLAATDWVRPPRDGMNWISTLALPALTSEYRAFAERCVAALHEAYSVSEPEQLVYRAWRAPEAFPEGVTLMPDEVDALDPGEHPMAVPELGLRFDPDA